MKHSGNERLVWLDSLRGIAALLVAVFHFWMIARQHIKEENSFDRVLNFFNYGYLDLGKIGVVLFFAISGFLIPYSLLRYKDNNIKRFIISRFFRLYPAYWVSLILTVILINKNPKIITLLTNFTMFQKFVGQPDLLGVYWTLQIELIFYIGCVALFLMKLLHKHNIVYLSAYSFIAMAFFMSIVRYITEIKLPVALPLALSIMFFGILWMRLLFNQDGIKQKHVYGVFYTILVMMVPISLLAYSHDYGYEESWYRYVLSYYTALLTFVIFTKRVKLVNPVLVFLGKISYSLYLIHLIVGYMVIEHSLLDAITTNLYIQMLLCLIISLVGATICYYAVEKPSVRLGRNLTKKLISKTMHSNAA